MRYRVSSDVIRFVVSAIKSSLHAKKNLFIQNFRILGNILVSLKSSDIFQDIKSITKQ
jgi:hypothetical protein